MLVLKANVKERRRRLPALRTQPQQMHPPPPPKRSCSLSSASQGIDHSPIYRASQVAHDARVAVDVVDAAARALDEQLGHDELLDGEHDAVLAADAERGAVFVVCLCVFVWMMSVIDRG